MFRDLREFIKSVEELGQCRVVEGADCNEEIGLITEVAANTPESPMLLFDSIKGYPKGYRVLSNVFSSTRRSAMAMGIPQDLDTRGLVEYWRKRLAEGPQPIPPVIIENAPIKENVLLGDDVDLYRFPSPKWHDVDGGKYIGTGDMVIMRDPDEGWVNFGTYRVQVHDKSLATIYIESVHHGDIIRRKYWSRGAGCPVVVVCGQEPTLTMVAGSPQTPWGRSEYETAGGLLKGPVPITQGVVTDLPIPAYGEIALEGEIVPPQVESIIEGPFGEFTGYASGAKREAAFRVKSILHRNDPILLGIPPSMNYRASNPGSNIRRSAELWSDVEKSVQGVKGVWLLEDARAGHMAVVSVKQMFGGHAKQVALACISSRLIASMAKWVIVVDDDIDPYNISEVLWAFGTRCDPADSIEIVRGCRGTALNPSIPPEQRNRGDITHSVAVVLACRPYYWMEQFPPTFKLNPETVQEVKQKWQGIFGRELT